MAARGKWVDQQRADAWFLGRSAAADLTEKYRQHYRLSYAPAPALIIYELLADFLGVKLSFDPLPADRFAQTRWVHGVPHVTINERTDLIQGVKDVEGVQRVAAWHEAIHVLEDRAEAINEFQRSLPGMEPVPWIAYRDKSQNKNGSIMAREFRAEEAGRAAAVSVWAVERLPRWKALLNLADTHPLREVERPWPTLYRIAGDLGVNITALVKQLEYDGLIRIERAGSSMGGRLFVPPRLLAREDDA